MWVKAGTYVFNAADIICISLPETLKDEQPRMGFWLKGMDQPIYIKQSPEKSEALLKKLYVYLETHVRR